MLSPIKKMPRVRIAESPQVVFISPAGAGEPVGERESRTRRTSSGKVVRKEISPTRYWTKAEALEFLKSKGYADVWRTLFDESEWKEVDAEIDKLAKLMEGKVRRRGHERNLEEKLEDFEDLLRDPKSTFTDLRQVVLSGGA